MNVLFLVAAVAQTVAAATPDGGVVAEAPADGIVGLGRRTGQPSAEKHPPSVTRHKALVAGPLTQDDIDRAAGAQDGAARECLEQARSRAPGVSGRIMLKFVVAVDGSVTTVKLGTSTVEDKRLEACVMRCVRALRFPKSSDGRISVVGLPYVFE